MIKNSYIKIPKTENLTTEYIENFFKSKELKVLRWAIVDTNEKFYGVNLSFIED